MKTNGQILAQEWNRWIAGDEGKQTSDVRTLPRSGGSQFLENRLWRAFQAGVKAAEKADAPELKVLERE